MSGDGHDAGLDADAWGHDVVHDCGGHAVERARVERFDEIALAADVAGVHRAFEEELAEGLGASSGGANVGRGFFAAALDHFELSEVLLLLLRIFDAADDEGRFGHRPVVDLAVVGIVQELHLGFGSDGAAQLDAEEFGPQYEEWVELERCFAGESGRLGGGLAAAVAGPHCGGPGLGVSWVSEQQGGEDQAGKKGGTHGGSPSVGRLDFAGNSHSDC